MAKDISKRTPRDLLRIIFRRRTWFLLGASVSAFGWLVAAHYALAVKYTATTVFERTTDTPAQEQARSSLESAEAIRVTMKQDLMGPGAVDQAAEDLGLTRGFPRDDQGRLTPAGEAQKQELIQRLMKNIDVTSVPSPAVDRVSVSFTDPDPRLVQKLPDTLVHNYITNKSKMIELQLTENQKFLTSQVADAKRRMQDLTASLFGFETKHAGMLPEDPEKVYDELQKIQTEIGTVRRQQAEAMQKVARYKQMLVEYEAKVQEMEAARKPNEDGEPVQVVKGPNPELQRLKDQLAQAKEQLDTARTVSHMTEKHPMVATLRAKIADLEARIKETPEEAVLHTVYGSPAQVSQLPPGPGDLDVQLAAAEATVGTTTGELERLREREKRHEDLIANSGPVRQEYLRLRADRDEQEATRKKWETRLTEVDMALEAQVNNRRTRLLAFQMAQPQYKPSSPRLDFVLGVALVGGLAFGGGLVFLVNTMDRSLQTTSDAVDFGMPVLGVIDEIVAPAQRLRRRLRWTIGPVLSVVILIALGLASLSVVLWLQYPEAHEKWKTDPVSFLLSHALTMEQPPTPEGQNPPSGAEKRANEASPVPLTPQSSTNAKP